MHHQRLVWPVMGLLVALLGYTSSIFAAAGTPGWPTYQHDPARSGSDSTQSSFTNPITQWIANVDGPVYAQPLFFNNQVLVATENDSVYALDASTGAVLWSQHLGTPVDPSVLPCGNIGPTVGITGTPVIDTSANVLYAVGFFAQPTMHYELYALDPSHSGNPLYHYTLNPSSFNNSTQQ